MKVIFYDAYDRPDARRYRLDLDDSFITYDADDSDGHEELAVACAEDFHTERDGFEAKWPRVFSLYTCESGGRPFARMRVELSYRPSFDAAPLS